VSTKVILTQTFHLGENTRCLGEDNFLNYSILNFFV